MHPLIARFLDVSNAVTALEKEPPLDADEAAFVTAASLDPKVRDAILKAKGRSQLPTAQQQQLIILTVKAATLRVRADAELGPVAERAERALTAEGASEEEAKALISQAILEEAFGYADDPDAFDAAYVAETLESLVPLSKVSAEQVDDWVEAWAKGGDPKDKALRLSIAETLLDAAWSEGPQPITPEHLDDAVEAIAAGVAASEFAAAMTLLGTFLGELKAKQIIGPQRHERLTHIASTAARNATGEVDPEEDVDDEE